MSSGVMNRSVSKDGVGWTRRNWEKPTCRKLPWYMWGHHFRQRAFFAVTRLTVVLVLNSL